MGKCHVENYSFICYMKNTNNTPFRISFNESLHYWINFTVGSINST